MRMRPESSIGAMAYLYSDIVRCSCCASSETWTSGKSHRDEHVEVQFVLLPLVLSPRLMFSGHSLPWYTLPDQRSTKWTVVIFVINLDP